MESSRRSKGRAASSSRSSGTPSEWPTATPSSSPCSDLSSSRRGAPASSLMSTPHDPLRRQHPGPDSKPFSLVPARRDQAQKRTPCRQSQNGGGGPVLAPVVHHDDLGGTTTALQACDDAGEDRGWSWTPH